MRRAYRIRALRFVINGATISGLLFLLALWGISREVWVARVFENAPTDLSAAFRFYVAAFTNTRIVVQVLCAVALASSVAMARSLAQSLRRTSYAFA